MVSGHPSKNRNSKQCGPWIILRVRMTLDSWHGRFFSRFACFPCMAYPTFDPEPDACYGYSRITPGTPRCPWAIKRSQQRSPCTRRPQRTSISCAAGKSERNNHEVLFWENQWTGERFRNKPYDWRNQLNVQLRNRHVMLVLTVWLHHSFQTRTDTSYFDKRMTHSCHPLLQKSDLGQVLKLADVRLGATWRIISSSNWLANILVTHISFNVYILRKQPLRTLATRQTTD